MRRKAVESSNIASVGYTSTSKTLEVRFSTGNVYQYTDVPKEIYSELLNATSKGEFFHQNIRNTYQYKKIK